MAALPKMRLLREKEKSRVLKNTGNRLTGRSCSSRVVLRSSPPENQIKTKPA
jgi:hypothetical protein